MYRILNFAVAGFLLFLLQIGGVQAQNQNYTHIWAVDPETEVQLSSSEGDVNFKAVEALLSVRSTLFNQADGDIYSLRSKEPASCRLDLTVVSQENLSPDEFIGSLSLLAFMAALTKWSQKQEQRVDRLTLVLSNLGDCERTYCRLTDELRRQNPGFTLDLISVNDPLTGENANELDCLAEQSSGLIAEVSTRSGLDRALGNVLRASSLGKSLIELEANNTLLSMQVNELKLTSSEEKGRLGEASILLNGLQGRLDESLTSITDQKVALYEANSRLTEAENQVRYDRQLRSIVEASYEKLQSANKGLREKLKASEEGEIDRTKELNDLKSEIRKAERSKKSKGQSVEDLLLSNTELETVLLSARADAVAEAEKRIVAEQKLEEVLISLESKHQEYDKLRRELKVMVDRHNDTLKKLTDANVDLSRILGDGGLTNFSGVKQEIVTLREELAVAKDTKDAVELQYNQLLAEFEVESATSLALTTEIHELKTLDLGGARKLAQANQKIAEISQDLLDEQQSKAELDNDHRLALLEIGNLKSEIEQHGVQSQKNEQSQSLLKAEIDSLSATVTQKELRIDQLKSELWSWREEADDKIKVAAQERVAEARRLAQQAEIHRQEALHDKEAAFKATKNAETRERKTSQELEILGLKFKSLETQLERREVAWREATKKLELAEGELEDLQILRRDERSKLATFSSQLGDLEHQMEALENEKQQLTEEVRAREEILDELQQHFADLQDEHISALAKLDKAVARHKEAEARLQDLMPIN